MEAQVSKQVQRKIQDYNPNGGLARTAQLLLALSSVNHKMVRGHLERVALAADQTAISLCKDGKAAFFAGLLHDIGKLAMPAELFNNREITAEEYELVKTHAVAAFEVLKNFHSFTAYCAGLHHALYKAGYGLTIEDFPKNWSPSVIKKVFEISTIVAICDDIDAARYRTTIFNGDGAKDNLEERLFKKFPNDIKAVGIALAKSRW